MEKAKVGDTTSVTGWVRHRRRGKGVVFLALNDGSTIECVQVVADPAMVVVLGTDLGVGSSVAVVGEVVASPGGKQGKEVRASRLSLVGGADGSYPLQPKRHSFEFLRSIPHLRMRTNTLGAIFRIRHVVSFAIHRFFHERGFFWLHTPIITAIDAEGGGDMFGVKAYLGEGKERRPFFGQDVFLTVSGQLAGECGALALRNIYTFGPTFRAENSNTPRHLAEFWMVEPEMAFCDLKGCTDVAEEFLQTVIKEVLASCDGDLAFLEGRALREQGEGAVPLRVMLKGIIEKPFKRVTYTEAIAILQRAQEEGKGFQHPVKGWGCDLQRDHERFLTEHFGGPVVVTGYPKAIKAFYMRQQEEDKRCVEAMDILFPAVGEVVGGSQREERLPVLKEAMVNHGVGVEALEWYLDTRRFGSVPHSGFGLGLERLILFITGMENVRDVVPFPRTPNRALC